MVSAVAGRGRGGMGWRSQPHAQWAQTLSNDGLVDRGERRWPVAASPATHRVAGNGHMTQQRGAAEGVAPAGAVQDALEIGPKGGESCSGGCRAGCRADRPRIGIF